MAIPSDPFMLLSFVNMKLRDGDYESLADLCASIGIEEDALKSRLASAGFEYLPEINQFR